MRNTQFTKIKVATPHELRKLGSWEGDVRWWCGGSFWKVWKTKAGWHSTKKLDLRLFYQVATSQIEDYTLQRKILILSIFHEDLARLKPKSFGVAYNHEIYFHCLRGIGNVNWKVGWDRTWSTFVVDRKWCGGEIKLSWKSRQILGRKFPANLHFRASTNVCQF